MLCPKGVKRYLQGNHPERLLSPLMRSEQGFRPTSWDEALGFTVGRMRDIQEKYGKDAIAIYGGASLSTEKSYLLGKFARVALGTRHIDYNGRLCMVSASQGEAKQGEATHPPLTKDQAKKLFRSVDEILSFVSTDTKLPIKHTVKRKLLTRDEVNKYLTEKFNEDEGAKRLARSEIVLKKFGLLDRDFDLRTFMISL